MKPTIIKNNFFENPEEVIKYSKQITWKKPSNQDNWPGLRSDNLFQINQKLHDDIVEKIVKLYFNGYKVSIENTTIQFHKITYEDWLLHDKKNTRIHKDFTDLAGIIYLNQDTNNFYNYKISVKASDVFMSAAAYQGLAEATDAPIHLCRINHSTSPETTGTRKKNVASVFNVAIFKNIRIFWGYSYST